MPPRWSTSSCHPFEVSPAAIPWTIFTGRGTTSGGGLAYRPPHLPHARRPLGVGAAGGQVGINVDECDLRLGHPEVSRDRADLVGCELLELRLVCPHVDYLESAFDIGH